MERIEVDNKLVYRAESGKKLKVKGNKNLYSEIICKADSELEVSEVEEDGE